MPSTSPTQEFSLIPADRIPSHPDRRLISSVISHLTALIEPALRDPPETRVPATTEGLYNELWDSMRQLEPLGSGARYIVDGIRAVLDCEEDFYPVLSAVWLCLIIKHLIGELNQILEMSKSETGD
ncbi:79915743-b8f1-4755-8212-038b42258ede [Thermothielavioides terrestris]|uniref:79915743-b8f1-4755-8212-038b42258ede n=1 Tax=Thermothielavioides terrestris TaxID=2587410 RepID=A0A3S4D3U6_9PEZI|nr:79915743-b8f1-4755-8212-038b42258ede [Thermothielavioides terrestris]